MSWNKGKKRSWLQRATGLGYGFAFMRGFFRSAKNELNQHRNSSQEPQDFDYAAKLYQVSDEELDQQYLNFRMQGYFFFIAWVVFTIYVAYRFLRLSLGFELIFALLDLILALYCMRAFYFAYLIKNRTLKVSFWSWIATWFE